MASLKDLKKRIGTVRNTQQTTRAMKMVSAAKLRRAQEAITSHRPYSKQIDAMIRLVARMSGVGEVSPLVSKGQAADATEGKKLLLILVTSDRGLCGSFNASVIKHTERWVAANRKSYATIELAIVGRKANEHFKSRPLPVRHYSEIGPKVTFVKAKTVAGWAIEDYLADKYDEVKFIYNEFKNAISQKVVTEDFLPILGGDVLGSEAAQAEASDPDLYISRPAPAELLDSLMKKHFAIQAFRVLLESQASEHGARMTAMENATRNAGDMIDSLTLQYNKGRQASITKELLEIISGSESQKAG